MVWYGMMLKDGQPNRFAEARRAVNNLWDTFQVRKNGEWGSTCSASRPISCRTSASTSGRSTRRTSPTGWVGAASVVEGGEPDRADARLRRGETEFYDFASLLRSCAPEFPRIQERLEQIARARTKPRLLIGANEILSGEFEAFDFFIKKVEEIDPQQRQDLQNRTEQEARRRISYEAVEASGTLPEIRRSQRIPGLKNIEGQDVLYWDGLYSQNPPISQFVSGRSRTSPTKSG